VKLAAFLARHSAGLDRGHAAAVTSLWEAWNRRSDADPGDAVRPRFSDAWAGFMSKRDVLESHAREWSAALASRRDLAAELVDFCDNVLK